MTHAGAGVNQGIQAPKHKLPCLLTQLLLSLPSLWMELSSHCVAELSMVAIGKLDELSTNLQIACISLPAPLFCTISRPYGTSLDGQIQVHRLTLSIL